MGFLVFKFLVNTLYLFMEKIYVHFSVAVQSPSELILTKNYFKIYF